MMPSVKSVTVYSERPWLNGMVKRRYEITLTDDQAIDHVTVTMPIKVDPSDDGVGIADKLLASKKSSEVGQYKESVKEGVNPFENPYQWNTRAELLLPILEDALSLPATDPMVINGLPFMSLVTDEELMALFNRDQAWVDSVRANAATLLASRQSLVDYVPVL